MILLDTNVISEAIKPSGSETVVSWIDAQAIETLYLSAITVAELRFGIAAMPTGRRKDDLQAQLDKHVIPLFADRILPFNFPECSDAYAALRASARVAGKAIATADGYIAAIAIANSFAVATRDTPPFEAAGVTVINPWEAGP